ncbi:MAG: hypothetical protein KJ548_11950 [Actinobacteria bacterium]|nr:hypothetical protein [Actinomycetota bacterium]
MRGPVEVLGSYRLDDPAGEVGVEAFVVGRGAQRQHVVFIYRGAPLEGDEARLVSTMEHSELGRRWVYDGTTDPVAVECFRRAVLGEQKQAALELWEDGRMVGIREPTVRLSARARAPADGATVRIVRDAITVRRLWRTGLVARRSSPDSATDQGARLRFVARRRPGRAVLRAGRSPGFASCRRVRLDRRAW